MLRALNNHFFVPKDLLERDSIDLVHHLVTLNVRLNQKTFPKFSSRSAFHNILLSIDINRKLILLISLYYD